MKFVRSLDLIPRLWASQRKDVPNSATRSYLPPEPLLCCEVTFQSNLVVWKWPVDIMCLRTETLATKTLRSKSHILHGKPRIFHPNTHSSYPMQQINFLCKMKLDPCRKKRAPTPLFKCNVFCTRKLHDWKTVTNLRHNSQTSDKGRKGRRSSACDFEPSAWRNEVIFLDLQ